MGKILSGALCILLSILFIVTVYVHGAGKRFSLEVFTWRVVLMGEALVSIGDVAQYWIGDSFKVGNKTIYPEDMGTGDLAEWIVGGVLDFFGSIKGFFVRSFYTVRHIFNGVFVVTTISRSLLPWNCVVDVEVSG